MPHASPLPEILRRQLLALVERDGERVTVARLGCGRQTLARAIAGMPLYAGTHALIRARLDTIDVTSRGRP